MSSRALVLTQGYFPHRIVSWQKAVVLALLGKAEVVASYDTVVRSPSITLAAPAVLRLGRHPSLTQPGVKLSRMNLFVRDGFRCAYCAALLPARELTVDHVVPRAQGGTTRWENVLSACRGCNAKKGNRTPAQAGLRPLRQPYRPKHLPLAAPLVAPERIPDEWRPFCAAP